MRPSGRFFLEQITMITITDPHTHTKHRIDAEAAQEIRDALDRSSGGEEIVFRATRLDKAKALMILDASGFETVKTEDTPTLGTMLDEDDKARGTKHAGVVDPHAKETE